MLENASFLVTSDLHVGRGSKQERKQRKRAFEALLDDCTAKSSALVLNGDIADDREPLRVVLQKWQWFRTRLSQMQRHGAAIHFVEGNHDSTVWNNQDFLGDMRSEGLLMHANGAVVTHGHILGLARLKQVMKHGRAAVERAIEGKDASFEQAMHSLSASYQFIAKAEKRLSGAGDIPNRTWEAIERNIIHFRGLVGDAVQRMLPRSEVASLIDHWSVTQSQQLAACFDASCCVVGHTHKPGIWVRENATGEQIAVLNTGSFVSAEPPHYVYLERDTARLYRFGRKNRFHLVQEIPYMNGRESSAAKIS